MGVNDSLLDVYEAARRIDTSVSGIYRAMNKGELAFVKIGRLRRIKPADLAAFVEARRQSGQTAAAE